MKFSSALTTLLALAALSGCTSYEGERQQSYTSAMARPVPTDVYPVIEGRRPVAAQQMSNEQAAAQSARMSALAGRRASGQISEAEYRRRLKELDALAANHGSETLAEIKN